MKELRMENGQVVDADRNESHECPEYGCPHELTVDELIAHLQWDHNRSDYEANRRVYELLEDDRDSA